MNNESKERRKAIIAAIIMLLMFLAAIVIFVIMIAGNRKPDDDGYGIVPIHKINVPEPVNLEPEKTEKVEEEKEEQQITTVLLSEEEINLNAGQSWEDPGVVVKDETGKELQDLVLTRVEVNSKKEWKLFIRDMLSNKAELLNTAKLRAGDYRIVYQNSYTGETLIRYLYVRGKLPVTITETTEEQVVQEVQVQTEGDSGGDHSSGDSGGKPSETETPTPPPNPSKPDPKPPVIPPPPGEGEKPEPGEKQEEPSEEEPEEDPPAPGEGEKEGTEGQEEGQK